MDITVHEVLEDGTLRELYKANGGNWGGTSVDDAFYKLLEDIVGKDVMEAFRKNHKYDDLDLLREFEVKKRTIIPSLDEKVVFKVPVSLSETFKSFNSGKEIKDSIPSQYAGTVKWVIDKLRVDHTVALSLYKDSCEYIRQHIKNLFGNPKVQDVHTVIMVGGFSESQMIQTVVRESCETAKVVIPDDAGLAVLKGAVLFGYEPNTLCARICRYNYGISCLLPFEGNNDKYEYRQQNGKGQYFCRYRFQPYVKEDEEIRLGEEQFSNKLTPLYADQRNMVVPVFASHGNVPRYVLDCKEVGKLLLDIPDTSLGMEREYEIRMEFGYTESRVTAIDSETKEKLSAKFDFLG